MRPIPLHDLELVEQVRAGKTEAYGELVRKYQDRVFNTCWRICGHLEEARDITQEAFLKAFENISSFRQQCGFYTWIFRVAVNLALSHRRKEQRRRTVAFGEDTGRVATQAEGVAGLAARASASDPADAVGNAELRGVVSHALNALDDDHRAVVVLRDIEGLDYREIGDILGLPPGTVKSRLHRARMALRKAILPWLPAK